VSEYQEFGVGCDWGLEGGHMAPGWAWQGISLPTKTRLTGIVGSTRLAEAPCWVWFGVEVGCHGLQVWLRSSIAALRGSLARAQPGCCQSTLTSLDVAEGLGAADILPQALTFGVSSQAATHLPSRWWVSTAYISLAGVRAVKTDRSLLTPRDAIMRNTSGALLLL
jgi:hypothetical protein